MTSSTRAPSTAATTRTRITAFDVSRGIAIIGMVAGHTVEGLVRTGHDEPGWELANEIFHTVRMPLFFFLAGIFLVQTLQKAGYRSWVIDKAQYLLYPYAVWALIRGAVELAALRVGVGESLTPVDVLVGLVWDPRAWYLPALFVSFAVLGGLYWLLRRFSWWWVPALVVIVGLSVLSSAPWWPPILEVHPFTAYMLVGVVLSGLAIAAIQISPVRAALIAFAAAGASALAVWLGLATGELGTTMSLPFVLASVPGVLMLVAVGRALDGTGVGGVLRRLGTWSLVIYVVHGIPLSLTRSLLERVGVSDMTLHVIAGTAVGLLVPVALALLMERGHLTWLITMPGYRRTRNTRLP